LPAQFVLEAWHSSETEQVWLFGEQLPPVGLSAGQVALEPVQYLLTFSLVALLRTG